MEDIKPMYDKVCGVVTLCKSFNYGAFLQAYALQEVIRSQGWNVEFVDVYDRKQSFRRYRNLLKKDGLRIRSLLFNVNKIYKFHRAEELLSISCGGLHYKKVILGSDEIWSLRNNSFVRDARFYGKGISADAIFSYAPSSGNTKPADDLDFADFISGISNLDEISVRDDFTKELVMSKTGRESKKVLDPAFLYDFEAGILPKKVKGKYILFYSYGVSNAWQLQIRAFADENQMKIISPCFYNNWCDESLACTPFEFLALISNADFIITDTFHGSVFSIKYNKNFLCLGAEKSKVSSLLEDFQLNDRVAKKVGSINYFYERPIDYSCVNEVLNLRKIESIDYLSKCLSNRS